MNKEVFKLAFKNTIPVMTGYLVLGMGFGILLKTAGYGVLWAFLMSLLVFAGSMQFVAVEMISSGAGLISIAISTLLVNARHVFYGLSMIEKYKEQGPSKPYVIYTLTDETYSLVSSYSGPLQGEELRKYYLYVSALDHCWWVSGSVTGSLLGSVIPFSTEGIDFVLTALFVTIVTDQWLSAKDHRPAIIGFGATLVCLRLFGPESFLIPSMGAIAVLLTALRLSAKEGTDNE